MRRVSVTECFCDDGDYFCGYIDVKFHATY